MKRIRTILLGVFILSLVIAGCATKPVVNPAVEWTNAKSNNTIEGYTDFLKNNPNSEFALEARQKLRVVLRETAINSVNGNRNLIRKGYDFPVHMFALDDLLKAFAQPNLPVSFTVLAKANKDQPLKRSEGSEDLKSLKAWEPFYAQLLKTQKDAAEATVTVAIWLKPLTTSIISTVSPDTSVTFYRDPTEINNQSFGISIKKEMAKGIIERERIFMTGVGMVIIRTSGLNWVFDFSQDGKSLFNEQ